MELDELLKIWKTIYLYGRIVICRMFPSKMAQVIIIGKDNSAPNFPLWFPNQRIQSFVKPASKWKFYTRIAPNILADRRTTVYTWGARYPDYVRSFCRRWNVPMVFLEDGFLRSVAFGSQGAPPISVCFDTRALHFDASQRSDLEELIQTFDFECDPQLRKRASTGIQSLIKSRLSKYNLSNSVNINEIYGPKMRKRVLVLGQVESDMSIALGCNRPITNNDVVRLAASENPGAQIVYKPHPEVLHGTKGQGSNPDAVRHLALILGEDVTLADAFETVDHVYTITSLAGFEALIRGMHVTCLGLPFYAGWGATDDRQHCPRRTAKRTPEEIFAAAYILYPKYFDLTAGAETTFEGALDLLAQMRQEMTAGLVRNDSRKQAQA